VRPWKHYVLHRFAILIAYGVVWLDVTWIHSLPLLAAWLVAVFSTDLATQLWFVELHTIQNCVFQPPVWVLSQVGHSLPTSGTLPNTWDNQ
jgi:hypothetical protein